MKNVVLAFGLGLLLSFFTTRYFFNKQPSAHASEIMNSQEINSKIKSISQNEYQDYLKLKDSAEKYKMADELLGKVMVLFLADLSLNIKNASIASVDKTLQVDYQNQAIDNLQPEKIKEVSKNIQAESVLTTVKLKEEKLVSATSENEALKFLKDLEIPDLATEIKKTKMLSQKQLSMINGKFVGVVTFDNKAEPWRIEWDVNAEIVNGKVNGKQLITLSNSKKVFSRTNGNGEIKDFAAFANDSSAILINSYGDDGYIQLYPFTNTGKFFGNYYLKSNDDKYKKIGIVFLERIN